MTNVTLVKVPFATVSELQVQDLIRHSVSGSVSVVEELLQKPQDPNLLDPSYRFGHESALHAARLGVHYDLLFPCLQSSKQYRKEKVLDEHALFASAGLVLRLSQALIAMECEEHKATAPLKLVVAKP